MSNKIWLGYAGMAASLAAFIIGPGQAAPQASAPAASARAEAPSPAKPTHVAVHDMVQTAAVLAAAAQGPAARPVRVVYPSHFSAQR
jgi:hypothetical protein